MSDLGYSLPLILKKQAKKTAGRLSVSLRGNSQPPKEPRVPQKPTSLERLSVGALQITSKLNLENVSPNPPKKLKKRSKKSVAGNPKPVPQPLVKEKRVAKVLPNGQQAFKVV